MFLKVCISIRGVILENSHFNDAHISLQTCTVGLARITLNKLGGWAVILDNFPVSGNKTASVNVMSAIASCSSHLSFLPSVENMEDSCISIFIHFHMGKVS